MKKTKLALAVSLATFLVTGCGSSDGPQTVITDPNTGTPDPVTPDPTTPTEPVANLYAAINNVEAGTSGQLKFPLENELTTGQVDVSVFYAATETETVYLTLHNETGSSTTSVGEVQLDEGKVKVRTEGATASTEATFTAGTWVNVNVTWDVDAGSFTAIVDGTEVGTFPMNNADAISVTNVAFKIGSNSVTDSTDLLVDNFNIYSDIEGTASVHSDDFEDYIIDEELDGAGDPYANSYSAIVAGIEDDGSTPTEPTEPSEVSEDFESYTVGTDIGATSAWSSYNTDGTTLIAAVSDVQSFNGANSLYLFDGSAANKPYAAKVFTAGATAAGEVTFNAYIPSENEKSTYFNIGSNKNSSGRFVELKVSGSGKVEFEAGTTDLEVGTVNTDAWVEYTIAWAPTADAADTNITVTLDGVELGNFLQSDSGLTADNIPAQLTIYTGDTSGDNNAVYIDDVDSDLF